MHNVSGKSIASQKANTERGHVEKTPPEKDSPQQPSAENGGELSKLSWPIKVLYIILAFAFFVLGVLGAFLPGIPTTPFFLLMSFFLIRVSPRLNAWVLQWPLVGKPIRDWQQKGGVTIGIKILAFAMVTIFVSLSIIFSPLPIYVKIPIGLLASVGLIVVHRLPTLPKSEVESR